MGGGGRDQRSPQLRGCSGWTAEGAAAGGAGLEGLRDSGVPRGKASARPNSHGRRAPRGGGGAAWPRVSFPSRGGGCEAGGSGLARGTGAREVRPHPGPLPVLARPLRPLGRWLGLPAPARRLSSVHDGPAVRRFSASSAPGRHPGGSRGSLGRLN